MAGVYLFVLGGEGERRRINKNTRRKACGEGERGGCVCVENCWRQSYEYGIGDDKVCS